MSKLKKRYTPDDLAPLYRRALLLQTRCGTTIRLNNKKKKPPNRTDLRQAEQLARGILSVTNSGLCAALSRDVVYLSSHIDHIYAGIYPVFELIDAKIKKGDAFLEASPSGYVLRDCGGAVLSEGPTFRDWLLDHVLRFGPEPVLPDTPAS